MSRIGKLPIIIPAGVTLTMNGQHIDVKGPKGNLSLDMHHRVALHQTDSQATITVTDPDLQSDRALWGLTRMLVANMITGVTTGYQKQLEINGVGFKAALAGKNLLLNLGFSHQIEFPIPDGVTVTVEKNLVTISGIDKQLVGETAATIRRFKKPEPYKGKGIKYVDEVIHRKAGKVVKAAGAK